MKKLDYNKIVSDYEQFCLSKKRKPSRESADENERRLACRMHYIKKSHLASDTIRKRIDKINKEYKVLHSKEELLDEINDFCIKNKRYPVIKNAKSIYESKLANRISTSKRTMNNNQLEQLQKLIDKYAIRISSDSLVRRLKDFINQKGYYPRIGAQDKYENKLANALRLSKSRKSLSVHDKEAIEHLYSCYGAQRKRFLKMDLYYRIYEYCKKNGHFPRGTSKDEYESSLSSCYYHARCRKTISEEEIKNIDDLRKQYGKIEFISDEELLIQLNEFCLKHGFFPSAHNPVTMEEKKLYGRINNRMKLLSKEDVTFVNELKKKYGSCAGGSVPEYFIYEALKRTLGQYKVMYRYTPYGNEFDIYIEDGENRYAIFYNGYYYHFDRYQNDQEIINRTIKYGIKCICVAENECLLKNCEVILCSSYHTISTLCDIVNRIIDIITNQSGIYFFKTEKGKEILDIAKRNTRNNKEVILKCNELCRFIKSNGDLPRCSEKNDLERNLYRNIKYMIKNNPSVVEVVKDEIHKIDCDYVWNASSSPLINYLKMT